MVDEGFVEDEAGLGLDPVSASALDPRTAALLRVGVLVAIGSPGVCLDGPSDGRWRRVRQNEITDVLLVIAPLAGLGRVVCAAPDLATALGYDIAAALDDLESSQ